MNEWVGEEEEGAGKTSTLSWFFGIDFDVILRMFFYYVELF
jgi:hypothetical protein